MTSANGGDFDLTMDELRAVVRFATTCAEGLLPDFEAESPEDSRPREALDAARAFAEGAARTNLQRTAAFAAHRAAKTVSAETAQLAALACGDAAASAYLHPIAQATQVGHILRAAACAARVAELRAGDHRVVAYNAAAVDADPRAARRAVRAGLEWIGEPGWEAHLAPLPFADEIVALRARSAGRADFVAALPDAWVDALTVSGTRDDARASLARMRAAGADCVVLQPVGDDPAHALRSLASIL